ncbi:MAG: lysophospholipase [Acidobacteriota bacterium]
MSTEGRLERSDEPTLFWRSWRPQAVRGTLQIVHGLGEHGGRYAELARRFVADGWRVVAGDLRGFGRSDGPRGHVDHFDAYSRDVAALAARWNDAGARPRVLYGHSMGGVVALRAVLDAVPADRPDALVLSAPGLRAHPRAALPLPLHWLALALARIAPRLPLPTLLDASAISRDPRVVAEYRADPLVVRRATPAWYKAFLDAQRDARQRAEALAVPTLLLVPTADRLVDPETSRRVAAAVTSSGAGPLTLRELDGWYHEPHHEPERAELLDEIARWLDDVLRPAADG